MNTEPVVTIPLSFLDELRTKVCIHTGTKQRLMLDKNPDAQSVAYYHGYTDGLTEALIMLEKEIFPPRGLVQKKIKEAYRDDNNRDRV